MGYAGFSKPGRFKSSYTNAYGCVEVEWMDSHVIVRDTKWVRAGGTGEQPSVSVPAELWPGFVDRMVSQDAPGAPTVRHTDDGYVVVTRDGVTLRYNPVEVEAFRNGVRDGEFNLIPAT